MLYSYDLKKKTKRKIKRSLQQVILADAVKLGCLNLKVANRAAKFHVV